MARFKCLKCGKEKEIKKQTLVFEDGKMIVKESKCSCGEWMEDQEESDGFGTSFQAPNDKHK